MFTKNKSQKSNYKQVIKFKNLKSLQKIIFK